MKLGEPVVTAIHYGAAIAFIALLIPIVLFFARDEGKRGQRTWQGFHTVSAALIGFGAHPRRVRRHHGQAGQGVLFGEWIAIWAFGAAWLAKGAEWKVLFRRTAAVSAVAGGISTESPSVPES